MRRPGNLSGMNYWFGDVSAKAKQQSMIQQKLKEVQLANVKNHTPLTNGQRLAKVREHLANPRSLMRKT